MRLLGIDYGLKKIGLAIGDDEAGVAAPLEVIRNDGEMTTELLAKRIRDEEIDAVVCGAPLSQGGHHSSDQLDKTRAFMESLRKQVTIPVYEEDESYTTKESIRIAREEKSGIDEDALAASLILQQFLNRT